MKKSDGAIHSNWTTWVSLWCLERRLVQRWRCRNAHKKRCFFYFGFCLFLSFVVCRVFSIAAEFDIRTLWMSERAFGRCVCVCACLCVYVCKSASASVSRVWSARTTFLCRRIVHRLPVSIINIQPLHWQRTYARIHIRNRIVSNWWTYHRKTHSAEHRCCVYSHCTQNVADVLVGKEKENNTIPNIFPILKWPP